MNSLKMIQKEFPNVKKIVNSKQSILVNVTKQDENTSKRRKHGECAMAVACKRTFGADAAIISRSVAFLIKGEQAIRFSVSDAVGREITSFDRGSGFSTGEYLLGKARPVAQKGGGSGKKTGNGQKRFRHISTNIRARLGHDKED